MAAVAGTLLLAGCTGGTEEGAGAAKPSGGQKSTAGGPGPRTRAEAVAFVRGLDIRPDCFGVGFRKHRPYESDPSRWAVLGEDCPWRREPLPDHVLAGLTDAAETSASVRTVTVYGKLEGETAVEEVEAGESFSTAARRVAERPQDAVMFVGLRSERAAAFARALRDTGHRGARVAGEHVVGRPFLAEAEGWMVGTAHADAEADPRTRAFATAHRDRHGRSPAPWAAEAYDAVRFAAHGLTAAGDDGPAALRSELLRRPWQGITRRIAYNPGGPFYDTDRDGGGFLYRVTHGAARFVARADDIGRRA
ncbi:ABC transporter substrate-binding protein [Streptomyces sp. NPDC020731]|uniref:ABC transporter substrate-binding protein n=1 Tax=Streptomyces sp. NPDC020731 TaxID=3365085 RepID=UPI0037A0BB2C